MRDDGLGEALRALAEEMNEAAARLPPELAPPPSFAVRGEGASLRFVITTDNGGGPATSHPIERVIEVRREGARLALHEAGAEPRGGRHEADALDRLRALCLDVLPDPTLG